MSTRIFLSYARGDDEPFVRRLHDDLVKAGFAVWFDRESLLSRGRTFHQEIKDAIRTEVDRIVYVGGPKAALSAYVREEWQLGLEFDHVVVTPILRLGDYASSVPRGIGLLHCEDLLRRRAYPTAHIPLQSNQLHTRQVHPAAPSCVEVREARLAVTRPRHRLWPSAAVCCPGVCCGMTFTQSGTANRAAIALPIFRGLSYPTHTPHV